MESNNNENLMSMKWILKRRLSELKNIYEVSKQNIVEWEVMKKKYK